MLTPGRIRTSSETVSLEICDIGKVDVEDVLEIEEIRDTRELVPNLKAST